MLCGSLDGTGVWERMNTCICMAESLCCPSELSQHCFLTSYTPIQNKKFLKNKGQCPDSCTWLQVSTLVYYFSDIICHAPTAATHSSTLAWKIPWTEEPGRLQSLESLRVGHDWATSLSLFTFMHWRSKWQPTPVFLPGESQGRGSLVGCRLWGRTESDTTKPA